MEKSRLRNILEGLIVFSFFAALSLLISNAYLRPYFWPKEVENIQHPYEALVVVEVRPDRTEEVFKTYYNWSMREIRIDLTEEAKARGYLKGMVLPWYAWAVPVKHGTWRVVEGDSTWTYEGSAGSVKRKGIPVELAQDYLGRFTRKTDTE